ncbi:hypothetical protein [Pedobacter sp. GR22-6]|uniref:hypothetical protein n=1 Tax=Pedobacter sp. GR22-6 TaxID=3127957 RepID=UPI00307DEE70
MTATNESRIKNFAGYNQQKHIDFVHHNQQFALDIYRVEADLSRRVISYTLAGLSFREYLAFTENMVFDPIDLKEITTNHREISLSVLEKIQPLSPFYNYLKNGYLPTTVKVFMNTFTNSGMPNY